LIIVITDGSPASVPATRQAIADAQLMGISVFGIGIRSAVSGFEEADFRVIQDTDELVDVITTGLKNIF
jgi:nitric oxide reductase activation protein